MNSRKRKITTGLARVLAIALVAGVAIAATCTGTLCTLFELGPGTGAPEAGITNILGNSTDAGPDWTDLFDANGNFNTAFGGTGAFIKDDVSAGSLLDRNVYSGGPGDKNSDIIADWTWTSSNVPAKDDISNAYAYTTIVNVQESNGTTGCDPTASTTCKPHKFVYVGAEREDPSGDSHIDIEFFQDLVRVTGADADGNCTLKQCGFSGSNTDGDLLINMDFTNGGGFGTLSVRKRLSGATNNYVLVDELTGEGCNALNSKFPNVPAGSVCGFNNGAPIDGGPWPNFDNHASVITNLPTNSFTEFGLDITALGFGVPCFSTVEVKTRSSQSFTASLKDFALQRFQECKATADTQIHRGASAGGCHVATDIQGSTDIPALTTVHDKAIVTGKPGFPTPTCPSTTPQCLTFKFFDNAECTGTPLSVETKALTQCTTPTATAGGTAAAESSTSAPLSPGSYSYTAVYSGDKNYPDGATGPCEFLLVSQFPSSVSTDIKKGTVSGASVLNTAVDASGAGTTVVDVATITGNPGGPDPTGTVTFRRFTAANCSGSFADETVTIVADADPTDGIATAVSGSQTLNTATGSFLSYIATYNGDANYRASVASKCEPLCAFPFIPK